jgi:hypothetical protein
MPKPFTHNLTIYQGATLRDTVTWKAGDPAAPVDLAGCTARAQFRKAVGSSEVLATLTTENGGVILGGAAGTIQLHMSAVDTAALTWRQAVYDLEITLSNGDVRRFMQGDAVVDPEVTRA